MDFYKIERPTTKQIFDAIINNEYTPIEKIKPKAKQILVLLKDYYGSDEILITFDCVTNTGGIPIFLTTGCSLYEIARERNEDFYEWDEDKQEHKVDLLACYLRVYETVFNI